MLIADDHPGFLGTVRAILCADPELHIVAECRNGVDALAAIAGLEPRIAVLDFEMPGLDGIGVADRLRMNDPALRTGLILLTMHFDAALVLRARKAGVRAFVRKENAATELIPAIHAAALGKHLYRK